MCVLLPCLRVLRAAPTVASVFNVQVCIFCTKFAQYLHNICTIFTQYLYNIFTIFVQYLHNIYLNFEQDLFMDSGDICWARKQFVCVHMQSNFISFHRTEHGLSKFPIDQFRLTFEH